MFLTQSGGILGPIAKVLGYVLNFIYVGLSNIGIDNLGISIILFAIFVRLILFPSTISQQKSQKINQIIQPELSKIQKKYKGKKDQQSMMAMQEEQQALYKKYGTSPASGCLPMLVQLPIMYALFKVIYNIPAYIPSIKSLYEPIAASMVKHSSKFASQITEICSTLNIRLTDFDPTKKNDLISFLGGLNPDNWNKVHKMFSDYPDVVNSMNNNYDSIINAHTFMFGINLAEYPKDHMWTVYLLIPISAAIFQFLQSKTMQSGQNSKDMPGAGMMKSMMLMMPLMSLFFYSILPAAIGLYWAATALFCCLQQVVLNIYFNHKDMDEVIKKQVEKAKKKNKKSMYDRIMSMDGSSSSTATAGKVSNTVVSDRAKMNLKSISSDNSSKVVDKVSNTDNKLPKGSIAAKANMMLNFDDSKDKGGK